MMKMVKKKTILTMFLSAVFPFILLNSSAQAASFDPVLAEPTERFPFHDVPAEYQERIQVLYDQNVFEGLNKDQFGWSLPIKRIDVAVILYQSVPMTTEGVKKTEMKDVPERAVMAVSALEAMGIVNGKTATSFGSNDTITRGEFALMASQAYRGTLRSADQATHTFLDATGRYKTAIDQLQASNITQGRSESEFGTFKVMTRGELALLIYNLQTFSHKTDN